MEKKKEKYDFNHLERMWRIYSPIRDFLLYNEHSQNNGTYQKKKHITWNDILREFNKEIDSCYSPRAAKELKLKIEEACLYENAETELPHECQTVIKRYTGRKSACFFKLCKEKYSPDDFFHAYRLLRKNSSKEIIQNTISASSTVKEADTVYFSKFLKITLDAFRISHTELDARIHPQKRLISKKISKGTRKIDSDEDLSIILSLIHI